MTRTPLRMRMLLLVAAAFALGSLACFAVPMYVIRPFRHQGANELALALAVKQIGPWLSIACAMLCLLLVVFTWPHARGWLARAVAISSVLGAVAGAFLARVNIYERMFHPLGTPQFESGQTAKLEPDDMVIAIRVNGISRAYSIREIAYHHVVNDTLGGVPVVATY